MATEGLQKPGQAEELKGKKNRAFGLSSLIGHNLIQKKKKRLTEKKGE